MLLLTKNDRWDCYAEKYGINWTILRIRVPLRILKVLFEIGNGCICRVSYESDDSYGDFYGFDLIDGSGERFSSSSKCRAPNAKSFPAKSLEISDDSDGSFYETQEIKQNKKSRRRILPRNEKRRMASLWTRTKLTVSQYTLN